MVHQSDTCLLIKQNIFLLIYSFSDMCFYAWPYNLIKFCVAWNFKNWQLKVHHYSSLFLCHSQGNEEKESAVAGRTVEGNNPFPRWDEYRFWGFSSSRDHHVYAMLTEGLHTCCKLQLADDLRSFFVIKPTRSTNFTNLFCHETLHVSDSSSVHHQEFIHCTLNNGVCHTGL
jgi:hypothetical protein